MEITLDKLAKNVADKALNDIKLDGKTIREWVEIIAKQQICGDMGEVSDGYHTFNQLYYQRAVLFACIVKQNKNKAWKSFKHSDGKYCFDSNGEWFIVGIDTPQGSYTYHYAKEYWDMFDCQELDCGKEWDGHTEEDVTRLLSLEQQPFINKPCISEGVCREDKMQVLDKIRAEIEQLPTKTITNWNGCCPDIDYPEIEYVDKNILLSIIDKYRTESEE